MRRDDDEEGQPFPLPKPARAALRRRVEDAARRKVAARGMGVAAGATAPGDPLGARWMRKDAERMDAEADALMRLEDPPGRGTGGELLVTGKLAGESPGLVDAVEDPTAAAQEASLTRLELACGLNVLGLALEAAGGAGAADPVQRMLAHQLAAAHAMAMRLAARADFLTKSMAFGQPWAVQQTRAVEVCRLANASARLMDSFQKGALALDRLAKGPRQVVRVEHVHVHPGGQAIVGAVGHTRGVGTEAGMAAETSVDPTRPDVGRLNRTPRCGARTRGGSPCRQPKVKGRPRCRMHGGAKGSGGPAGARNGRYVHGGRSAAAVAERAAAVAIRRRMRELLRLARELLGG